MDVECGEAAVDCGETDVECGAAAVYCGETVVNSSERLRADDCMGPVQGRSVAPAASGVHNSKSCGRGAALRAV
jgi:hypothetical protein